MSLALLTAEAGGPAPYIGPQTLSRTFLIIPENSEHSTGVHFWTAPDNTRIHGKLLDISGMFRTAQFTETTRLLNYVILTHYA